MGAAGRTGVRELSPLVGVLVNQLRVDLAQVQLVLGDGRAGRLALVSDVSVEGPRGALIGPATSGPVVSALLGALGAAVTGVGVEAGGALVLDVGDLRVRVVADEDGSAWDATLGDGTLVVCRPGGEVDVVVL